MAENSQKKVLIIEDDPSTLFALKKLISEADYQTLTATEGQTGLTLIKKEKPDLVLLDIILPKVNGFDILELTKKDAETKNIPILVLTNLNDEETRAKAATLGAVGHLVKLETYPHEILRKVEQYITKKDKV